MMLHLQFDRADGAWRNPTPRIVDLGFEFSLDPNNAGDIRIRPGKVGEWGAWVQFDIDRLHLIYGYLIAARDGATA